MSNQFKIVLISAAALTATFLLFFFQVSHIPLWSSDEGRYGEIAREMWVSRNFLIPHFNYIEYLEKPVLSPLVASLFMSVFGVNSLAARLPSILSAIAGLWISFHFAKRMYGLKTALLTVLILLTSVGYVLVGRFAVIDMQMLFLMTTTVFFLMRGVFEQSRVSYLLSYVFMGLAVLTKGLIGIVLPGLIFLCFVLWTRRWRELGRLSMGWGILIVLLVAGPWYMMIFREEPEFFKIFILQHHFGRFASGHLGRTKPFWFFFYVLPVISFPWTLFLPAAMVRGLKVQSPFRDQNKFLICWITVIFVFFSISKSKLPYYIVPLCVPIALLTAHYFEGWLKGEFTAVENRFNGWIWNFILIACIGGLIGLTIAAFAVKDEKVLILRPVILVSAGVIGGFGCLGFWLYRRDSRERAVLTMAVMIYAVLLLIFWGMIRLSPSQSTKVFADVLRPILKDSDLVASYGSPDHFSDFPFFLERRVAIVGPDRGTLALGSKDEDYAETVDDWFFDKQTLAKFFNERNIRTFCLIDEDQLPRLIENGLSNYKILHRSHGRILISNQDLKAGEALLHETL